MAKTQIALSDATAKQLQDYNKTYLHLDLSPTLNAASIVSKMREAGFTGDVIEVETAYQTPDTSIRPAATQPKAVADMAGLFTRRDLTSEEREIRDAHYVDIEVHEDPRPTVDPQVKISLNGRALYLNRGERSPIRWPFYQILVNAVQNVPVTDKDGNIESWRRVPTYPHTVLTAPYLPEKAPVAAADAAAA